jgi:hypothetical protein
MKFLKTKRLYRPLEDQGLLQSESISHEGDLINEHSISSSTLRNKNNSFLRLLDSYSMLTEKLWYDVYIPKLDSIVVTKKKVDFVREWLLEKMKKKQVRNNYIEP